MFRYDVARKWSQARGVTLLCGRFEGIDERVIEEYRLEEISIGDFILTCGEVAAQVLIDATVRLIPRVLGNPDSIEEESFNAGLLEYPQYTRPVTWRGRGIPEVLLSGHHAEIAGWRRARSEDLTRVRRPDLLDGRSGTRDENRDARPVPVENATAAGLIRGHEGNDMNMIEQLEAEQVRDLATRIPDFKAGDSIRVGYKIIEGTRSRVQNYEGVCISRKGGDGIGASFTVRKISFGEGVERSSRFIRPILKASRSFAVGAFVARSCTTCAPGAGSRRVSLKNPTTGPKPVRTTEEQD